MSEQIMDGDSPPATGALAMSRLAAGALQGLALYLIYLSFDQSSWPSTQPYVAEPLIGVFGFVPLVFIQGAGTMRGRTLAIWVVAASAILGALAWYDVWRRWDSAHFGALHGDGAMTALLVFFTAAGLFIAQALISAADSERKWIASYGAYFDFAWKLGVQLALALIFVAVFWGVLWLGAALFNLINLSFFETLLEKRWFWIPATTLAIALSIHATDVRAKLIAGTRTIVLTLLAWLLPLMTLLAAGFLASLLFTGLAPLWATKRAAGLLLTAAAVLVILFNAAYQRGEDREAGRPKIWRLAELAAAAALLPIVAIAAYAIWLRVAQYGWTMERVVSAAATGVAACYAIGYGIAAVRSLLGGAWMQLASAVNVVTAFVVLVMLLALFSPLADPARLSVNSQMARLHAGAVHPTQVDFNFLARAGRYGRTALDGLSHADFGTDSATVHSDARMALRGEFVLAPQTPEPKPNIAGNLTVYPKGRSLPPDFVNQDFRSIMSAPTCLQTRGVLCEAYLIDLNGDGREEIVVAYRVDKFAATVFQRSADGSWVSVGDMSNYCAGVVEQFRSGAAKPVAPVWNDLAAGGQRLTLSPATQQVPCE